MVGSELETYGRQYLWHDMWCHSCICLEGQKKFAEDICEGKLSLIPDLNSGSSRYEAEVPCMGWNFLFYIGLISFLCHVINT